MRAFLLVESIAKEMTLEQKSKPQRKDKKGKTIKSLWVQSLWKSFLASQIVFKFLGLGDRREEFGQEGEGSAVAEYPKVLDCWERRNREREREREMPNKNLFDPRSLV